MFTTLIAPDELQMELDNPNWAIVDCRFWLGEPLAGRRAYRQGHIAGAVYADLNQDLSAPVVSGVTGRHPLPDVSQVAEVFSRLGIGPGVQVVAYDSAGGALAAARLWWLLRWLGHFEAAVLDGGWPRWERERRPVRSGEETRPERRFDPQPRPELVASSAEVERRQGEAEVRVLDARSAERYGGQNETIDPVAGHIPGAVSAPYSDNLDAQGNFRPAEELRVHFHKLIGEIPAGQTIHYCGSGVTAAHNLLAMMHAGLGEGRLYAGSWSEWITDARRPVSREA